MRGETRKYLSGESSSDPDDRVPFVRKPEMLDFEYQCDTVSSTQIGDNRASSSGSNMRSFFIGMGFVPSLVDKVIEENGEDNVDLLMEILMECSGSQSSNSHLPRSVRNSTSERKATAAQQYSTSISEFPMFVVPKEELVDEFDDKRTSLLEMNFSAHEVEFAIEKLGEHAPLDELVDFITAAQIAENIDDETDNLATDDAEKEEVTNNEILFWTMEKTLCLLKLGFSENEVSSAIENFGAEAPVSELADSICAYQLGESYIRKSKHSTGNSNSKPTSFEMDSGPSSIGMENDRRNQSHDDLERKTADFGLDAASLSSDVIRDEVRKGKRPKEEYIEEYPDAQFGRIGIEKNHKGKRSKQVSAGGMGSSFSFEPTWVEEKVDPDISGFGLHKPVKSSLSRKHNEKVCEPPYFFYGSVETMTFDVWSRISKFLYGIKPEFVDTMSFSALSRKEGYVHNLPTENRFHIIPKPPMSIEDTLPQTKRWRPLWDTRKQISCINFETSGVPQICDRLGRMLVGSRGELSSQQQREILHDCQTLNLIWIGQHKLGCLEPEHLELILGYPLNHSQAAESSVTERLHSLKYCFQVHTLGYHLSVLKSLFPEGITMLSLFSGMGGAEVALDRLGIHLKGVVSVESSEIKRRILRRWWQSSKQTGQLEQIDSIQKLTTTAIDKLMEKFGGFDFIICQDSLTLSSRSLGADTDGAGPPAFDFLTFMEVVRVMQRVRSAMGRKQRGSLPSQA